MCTQFRLGRETLHPAAANDAEDAICATLIRGDGVTLKQAFLTHDVESTEFKRLLEFVAQTHSDHYGTPVRTAIWELVKRQKDERSLDSMRAMACSGRGNSFIEQFVRFNLASHCSDNAAWHARATSLGKLVAQTAEDGHTLFWWIRTAQTSTGTTVAAPKARQAVQTYTKEQLATARQVAPEQLLTLNRSAALRNADELVRSDVTFSMVAANSAVLVYILDPSSRIPVLFATRDASVWNQSCALDARPSPTDRAAFSPLCAGRIVVHAPAQRGAVRILSIENIKPLARGAAASQRR